jgi:hypothetical protein
MKFRVSLPCLLAALLFAAWNIFAQAALTINGVTDSSTYSSGSVTLRVPSTAGYTYRVQLDGAPIPTDTDIVVNKMDYHELAVWRTNTTSMLATNKVVRFIVISTERGSPEKGLIKWTPYPPINSTDAEFAGAQLQLMVPSAYPQDLPIPLVARVEDAEGRERRANGYVTAAGFENPPVPLQILRGVGSGFLAPATNSGPLDYPAQLGSLTAPKQIQIDATTTWLPIGGTLSGNVTWPENSRIFLTSHVNIPSGSSLTIGAGTIIKLSPLVNITNSGTMTINGTINDPVVFTATNVVWPENNAGAWGGFIMNGATASLVANGTIMAGGGGATSFNKFGVGASHRSEEPVLLIYSGAHALLTNCAIINTAGQVGNGYNCEFTADHCLFQRAITCGEYAGSSSVITINHSAVIEFPNDDGVVDAAIADADYDGIYFTEGTHILQNSLFGFAKDDAIDSGSGGAGTMWVSNCWVESALHEAHAWSGGGRQTWSYDTVLMNSGQGIECGWSTGNNSPLCFADHLLSLGNSVGARVGDNYDWSYTGFLRLTNSLVLNNYRDIFLKTWNAAGSGADSNSWVDRILQVDFRSNQVTTVESRFPGNLPWTPALDGPKLAYWMTTPPSAPVGIGLAVRTNRFTLASLWDGVPVRLSSFTTNFVSVDYAFETSAGTLGTGTLTFAPGETLKRIFPAGFDMFGIGQVDVVLRTPVNGELTSRTNATYAGVVAAPQITLNVITNRDSAWRLSEGVFASLSNPSALPVTLDYHFTTTNGTVENGTLVFPPLETRKQIFLTSASPFEFSQLQLDVDNPTNATLFGTSSLTYIYTVVPLTLSLTATNQPSLDTFASGVTVVLNAPATTGLQVDYRVEGNRSGVTNGTLAFAIGALSALLQTPTVIAPDNDFIKVTLSNPQKASLAGPDTVYYVKTIPVPPQTNSVLVASGSGTRWYFRYTASAPAANWNQDGYDYSSWTNAPAQLGFGDNDENGKVPNVSQVTTYFRRTFVVSNASAYASLYLWLLRDDGGVVYINGQELYRSSTMPQAPKVISYTTWATNLSTTSTPPDNTVDTATIAAGTLLRNGTNEIAVEIHQFDSGSSDISFDLRLEGIPQPAAVSQPLYLGRFGNQLTLAWGDASFQLLTATNITGPWATNPVTGVFSTPPSNIQTYFQLRHP